MYVTSIARLSFSDFDEGKWVRAKASGGQPAVLWLYDVSEDLKKNNLSDIFMKNLLNRQHLDLFFLVQWTFGLSWRTYASRCKNILM